MTDQDLIRRCVERAEGFEWDDNTLTGNAFIALPKTKRQKVFNLAEHWRDADDPHALTALAAQLVRQVDALGYEVEIYNTCTGFMIGGNKEKPHEYLRADGPDRTLNTLRCIDEFYRGPGDE